MKRVSKIITSSLFAAATLTSVMQPAHAISPNFPGAVVAKINSQGFDKCKSMGDSGYTAVARGVLGDGGGGDRSSGYRHFQIRTCFTTNAACNKFIDRIDHKISQIEQLYYAGCKSRA